MPESMEPIYIIIGAVALVIVFIVAFVLGMLYRKKVSEREIFSAEEEAKRIINESIKSAENKKREALLETKEEIHKNRTEYEREVRERRAELARLNKWTRDKMQFVWETYSRVKDLILAVQPGQEFVPGLRLLAAPGHRYDHSILQVTSLDEQLVHISDALVHPLFMGHRDWYSTYDANPTQAVETKARLLDMCASENALVFGAHFPFPGLGRVRRGHERWTWHPVGVA